MRDRVGFRGKKCFYSQNWENGPKMGQKQGFLCYLKMLLIFAEFVL